MAPPAVQGTAAEEDGSTDPWPIVDRIAFNIKDLPGRFQEEALFYWLGDVSYQLHCFQNILPTFRLVNKIYDLDMNWILEFAPQYGLINLMNTKTEKSIGNRASDKVEQELRHLILTLDVFTKIKRAHLA